MAYSVQFCLACCTEESLEDGVKWLINSSGRYNSKGMGYREGTEKQALGFIENKTA